MIANLAKQTPQLQIPKKKDNWSHGWQQKETGRIYGDRIYVHTYILILRVQLYRFSFLRSKRVDFSRRVVQTVRETVYFIRVHIQLPGTCLRRSVCGTFLSSPQFPTGLKSPPPALEFQRVSHRVPKGFSSSSQGFLIEFPRVPHQVPKGFSSSSQGFLIKFPKVSHQVPNLLPKMFHMLSPKVNFVCVCVCVYTIKVYVLLSWGVPNIYIFLLFFLFFLIVMGQLKWVFQ
jgi:hypothetical protein